MRRSPRIATKTTTIDFSRTPQHVQYWSAHTLAPNSTRHGLLAENQPETGHHDRQRGQDNRSRPSIDLNRTHRGKRPPCLAPHPPMKKVWLAGEGSVNKSTTPVGPSVVISLGEKDALGVHITSGHLPWKHILLCIYRCVPCES